MIIFGATDPFLTTFYYVEKRNGILRKNRGEGFEKSQLPLKEGRGGVKNCQYHLYVINEWSLKHSIIRMQLQGQVITTGQEKDFNETCHVNLDKIIKIIVKHDCKESQKYSMFVPRFRLTFLYRNINKSNIFLMK